jgi:hypothetical protein
VADIDPLLIGLLCGPLVPVVIVDPADGVVIEVVPDTTLTLVAVCIVKLVILPSAFTGYNYLEGYQEVVPAARRGYNSALWEQY